ncbi:DUF6361 family protein [Paracoccus sp. IB05]|uniref:DUF6361 family protein n=1 Tax=Paracoccus sp. IB05 TaxID=2779367 RepID=UPI0018E8A8DB|nr:hypothetical protein [Paracoccus sp. IB05]
MSFFGWVDFDQADRDRTRRIMDLFGAEDSRDELGLGAIRDAVADLLFPGTSTIQTRLRYMMFVPWIYQIAGQGKGSVASRRDYARALEIRLIDALDRGGESKGVIGSEARESLKRLPSDVYWAGLRSLGIRQFDGSRNACLEASPGEAHQLWSAGLPAAPDGFLQDPGFKVDFQMTPQEADFLRDRLVKEAPVSLFTLLSRVQKTVDCKFIWLHPDRKNWPADLQSLVLHAERFSRLMHGASLLYNLLLCEEAVKRHGADASAWHDRRADYDARLKTWADDTPQGLFDGWLLAELWDLTAATVHRISPRTRDFIAAWLDAVRRSKMKVGADDQARQLVREREIFLKKGKSRFRNEAALARWGGASGLGELNFRWSIAQSHLEDLHRAG